MRVSRGLLVDNRAIPARHSNERDASQENVVKNRYNDTKCLALLSLGSFSVRSFLPAPSNFPPTICGGVYSRQRVRLPGLSDILLYGSAKGARNDVRTLDKRKNISHRNDRSAVMQDIVFCHFAAT